MIGVGEDDLGAGGPEVAGARLFTEPCVATGMNAGVSTAPCAVRMRPSRGRAVDLRAARTRTPSRPTSMASPYE